MSITTLASSHSAVKHVISRALSSSLLVQPLARDADLLPSFLFYQLGRLVLPAFEVGDLLLQLLVTREPRGVERAVLQRLLDGAAGFRPMLAIAEGALPRQLSDILKSIKDAFVSTPEL